VVVVVMMAMVVVVEHPCGGPWVGGLWDTHCPCRCTAAVPSYRCCCDPAI
jgi:hypothetical protein